MEPYVQPEQIDLLAQTLLERPRFPIATLAKRIEQAETLFNPNAVKVVFSQKHGACVLQPPPHSVCARCAARKNWLERQAFYKHTSDCMLSPRSALLRISRLHPTPLDAPNHSNNCAGWKRPPHCSRHHRTGKLLALTPPTT